MGMSIGSTRNCSASVDKHAEEKEQQVNHQQHHQGVVGKGHEAACDLHRHPFAGNHVAEEGDGHHHQNRYPGNRHGFHAAGEQSGGGELAIDEHAEDDGIQGGDDGGFRRGEGAGEDAADDEYRRQQRPKRLFERPSAFGGGRFRRLAIAAFLQMMVFIAISKMVSSTPGTKPARKSLAMETSAMTP